ncbi:MAG: A/G-specific adenine glycosylase [Chloroflexi bacterium]|nr:A/G-specific adenine glycosylase [Chloroflexota bacterium]
MTAFDAVPDRRTAHRLRRAILGWYAAERHDFPWRGTRDPYAVLVSEVMLQQTRASRVAPRFTRFMGRFPTAADLAAATPADVIAEWSGLGYNRRALALQQAAAEVVAHGWPRDVAGLQGLPGIGQYTARAVPAWTHATMELGAAICRSRRPRCGECPLAVSCPSRDAAPAVPVPRQSRLRGSERAYRGAVVRILARTPGRELKEPALRRALAADAARIGPALDDPRWERLLGGLQRGGLVHRSPGMIGLGAATIRA